MATRLTRRQVLTQMGIAAAAVHTLDPHELCCVTPASAQTTDKDLFEMKKVGNEVYAASGAAVEVITSEQTRANLTRPDNGGVAFIDKQIAALPAEIQKLR